MRKPTPFAVPSNEILVNGLPKEVVEHIVRRHWNEIRYCYEKELSRNPNLAGKVAVDFEIGPLGEVISADVRESTLESPAVTQCIVGNVKRWVFPAPGGGGVVDVHYPFLFAVHQ